MPASENASLRNCVHAPVLVSVSAFVTAPVRRSTVVRRAAQPPPLLRAASLLSVYCTAPHKPISESPRPRAQSVPATRDQSPPYSPFGSPAVLHQEPARNVATKCRVRRNTRARTPVASYPIAHSTQAARPSSLPELQVTPPPRVTGAPQTVQTPVPPSTNSRCPEPEPHLGEVPKRPRAPVRIIDAAGAPVRSLRPLSTPTRDLSSNAPVIQVDVVHCYAMSVHARASTNCDETFLRVVDHYSQSALHRDQSLLAEARAQLSG